MDQFSLSFHSTPVISREDSETISETKLLTTNKATVVFFVNYTEYKSESYFVINIVLNKVNVVRRLL